MISRREKKPFKQYKPTNVTMQKKTHTQKKNKHRKYICYPMKANHNTHYS